MRLRDFELTLPPEQRWENLTLANDFMFSKVMRDPELCTEMIRRIFPDMDIGHIEFTQPQKSVKHSFDTRGVRFDVFSKFDSRKLFDTEVQTTSQTYMTRRTRAYHIAMGIEALETETLKTSGTYDDMPDTFVIFICTFDPFGLGLHKYTFSNICHEVDGLKLNDGAVTIFLNTCGTSNDISGELKAFLDFMLGRKSDDPFVMRLDEQVKLAKLNAKWRRLYMKHLLHENAIRREGIAIGKEEGIAIGKEEGIAIGKEEGIALGEERGRSNMLNTMLDLMRKQGLGYEQINNIRDTALNIFAGELRS